MSEAQVSTTGFYHCQACKVDRCCSCFEYRKNNPGRNIRPVNHEAKLSDARKEETKSGLIMTCSNGHKLKKHFIKPLAY